MKPIRKIESLMKLTFICLLVMSSLSPLAEERLVDHRGESFSIGQLQGSVVLLIIGFTNCEDICPTEMARATIALNEMKEDISRVKPIFLTVDPERDSPEIIAKYLKSFHPSFTGISGNSESLAKVVSHYGVSPKKKKHHGDNKQIDHGYSTFILNTHGEIEVAILPGLPPSHLSELLFKIAGEDYKG